MKWVPDSTGRFRYRPYYERDELDIECERTVTRFLENRYDDCRYPVTTDDLAVMIEQDTSDLDMYADLSGMGADVEGFTDFFPDRQPAVKISKKLTLDSNREHRLRTTLAHEYAHVKFHSFLWELSRHEKPTAGNRKFFRVFSRAFRDNPDEEGKDWMEWQAGYACLAFLVPLTSLNRLMQTLLPAGNPWINEDSEQAGEIAGKVAETFDVSARDARDRLLKLGFLQKVSEAVYR
ncbi:MAG: hypothetical protein JW712_01915 [Dehalococcoidales bacterium]|nr:hypothetical protein [Dehalococcoidales bacterium]